MISRRFISFVLPAGILAALLPINAIAITDDCGELLGGNCVSSVKPTDAKPAVDTPQVKVSKPAAVKRSVAVEPEPVSSAENEATELQAPQVQPARLAEVKLSDAERLAPRIESKPQIQKENSVPPPPTQREVLVSPTIAQNAVEAPIYQLSAPTAGLTKTAASSMRAPIRYMDASLLKRATARIDAQQSVVSERVVTSQWDPAPIKMPERMPSPPADRLPRTEQPVRRIELRIHPVTNIAEPLNVNQAFRSLEDRAEGFCQSRMSQLSAFHPLILECIGNEVANGVYQSGRADLIAYFEQQLIRR